MSHLNSTELFGVSGMVFVITGGGTGIGAMMARALDFNHAAKVYIVGRRLHKLEEVAASAVNKSIVPLQGDITSKASLAHLADTIKSQVPFVNAVIANSGGQGPTLNAMPQEPSFDQFHAFLWQTSMEEFNEVFMQNSTGMFYTMLAFLPLLHAGNSHPDSPTVREGNLKGTRSQFIATSSIGAFSRVPGMGYAYAGSKSAGVHMCKQMATKLVTYGIRVNVLAPGIYPSDMSAAFTGGGDVSREGAIAREVVPAERAGSEQDVAGATLFLCSRAGAYINGNVLISDGGRLSIVPATY